ncbi:hypothetical protein L6V77_31370 [Myxococcota bacterium]|nr:hypothetical protein [Myxococcota bacterium]
MSETSTAPNEGPEDLLARLIAEVGEAHVQEVRRRPPLADADARLAALAADVAVPLPPPVRTPTPAPRPRLLPLTPVPVVRRSTPPLVRPAEPPPAEAAAPAPVAPPGSVPEPPLPPPLPKRASRPVEVSDPPIPLPEIESFEGISPTPAPVSELAVDDLDILEAEESVGPGTPRGDALAGPLDLSVGDLDGAGENTVDRDLKAFFADDSIEVGGPADAALLRPEPGDSIESPSSGAERRNRRDKSLLTNVKKLFKK